MATAHAFICYSLRMTERKKIKLYTVVTVLWAVAAGIWTARTAVAPTGLRFTIAALAWLTAVLFGAELARLRGWFGRH